MGLQHKIGFFVPLYNNKYNSSLKNQNQSNNLEDETWLPINTHFGLLNLDLRVKIFRALLKKSPNYRKNSDQMLSSSMKSNTVVAIQLALDHFSSSPRT